MWQHISEYINPFYNEDHGILIPSTSPQHIRYNLYCGAFQIISYYFRSMLLLSLKVNQIEKVYSGFLLIYRLWRSLYARFDANIHPRESCIDHVCALDDQNKSLEDHIKLLRKV